MINLFNVSDQLEVFGREMVIFDRVDFALPPGRYALLSKTPEYHRPVIDLLAGIRPPQHGQIDISGRISWPIGRLGFVRGRPSGLDVINLVSDIYHIDRDLAAQVVTVMVSRPDTLSQRIDSWQPFVRQEFIFAIGLIPEFDIYILDGPLPFEETRFARMWQALFEERLAGKTLILSTYRQKQMLDYCAKGLVYETDGLRIEHDLEQCIEQYPTRPSREEFGGVSTAGESDGGDFLF